MEVDDNRPGSVGTAIIKRNASHMQLKQEQIFTNWANYILARRGLRIDSVREDMANGVLLINLVEILCDDTIKVYNKRPTMQVHNIENITIAMKFLKEHGFNTSMIAPAAIAQGDPKSMLGFFWSLIAHFQLRDLRNKWEDQDGDQHNLNELQREIDLLQAEQQKRKEAGEDRRKRMTERTNKRKQLIDAQKAFTAKGNEFKNWALEKTTEVKKWKCDGEPDKLEAELASIDEKISQECDQRLSEIAGLWKVCEDAGAEETPALLGEMRHCVANLEGALEDARTRIERKRLQDSFTNMAGKLDLHVGLAVQDLLTAEGETLEDVKKALAKIEKEEGEMMLRGNEMKGDAEKVWNILMQKGGPEGVCPYNKHSLLELMEKLSDTIAKKKEELKEKIAAKGKQQKGVEDLLAEFSDYKKWAKDAQAGLMKALEGSDDLEALKKREAALADENDKKKEKLKQIWKELIKKDPPAEKLLPPQWASDLDSLHSNVVEALKGYKDALACKEKAKEFAKAAKAYKDWSVQQVEESKDRRKKHKDMHDLNAWMPETKKQVENAKRENEKKRKECEILWDEIAKHGNSPAKQYCGDISIADLKDLHNKTQKALDDETKEIEDAEKKASELSSLLVHSSGAYRAWAKETSKAFLERPIGATPGEILRAARALEDASKMIRADNNEKRDQVLNLIEENARVGTIILAKKEVDDWHAEVEHALANRKKIIDIALTKAEASQGTQIQRDVGTSGGTLIRRRAMAKEAANPCKRCKQALEQSNVVLVDGTDLYHASCFNCATCHAEFDKYYWDWKGAPYCHPHYIDAAGLICAACNKRIEEDRLTVADDKKWHTTCFCCTTCKETFESGYYAHEDKPYCYIHYMKARGLLCAKCGEPVGQGDKSWEKKAWHRKCWVCTTCDKPFGADGFFGYEGKPYCPTDYKLLKQKLNH